ncbi:HAD-IB family phosphatase [Pyxidicoccus fallax]|uniref:HAD-IB family phosphatase n=1 Tax=Pyxidicoccus fallax TaxID=394095 RepID=A0A848LME6_9BACT|nr:HAD-IB family phosphatase [Pyxidicoccus fallax]NMO18803.1 HAD-IB family phosphatase [Pyxidicoccus fallax]NPC84371.1 HAD-IB family phosphatase [Pyxidicoccus fallax]
MEERWALICDFDATATVEDLGNAVAIHFGGHDNWRRAEDEYLAGQFDFATLLQRIFHPIRASQEEVARFARERAVLRHGFEALVSRCREAGRPFVLASAGLDVYIHAVLERLDPVLRGHLQVRANEATCAPEGMQVRFPGAGGGCGKCGSCKRVIVQEWQRRGYKVAYCGDGASDRCAADVADWVFARASLHAYCRERAIPHRAFESFHEVIEAFPGGW